MKNKTKITIRQIAAFIMGSVLVIGAVGAYSYYQNGATVNEPTGGLSGGLTVNAGEESGAISLFAAGDVVTNDNGTESTTINVETVYPSEVVIDFSLSWSGSADWSSGKEVSAYVTATPAEDTRSVTLTCLQAFGDQIVLTATVAGTNNSASATVDYLRKVEGFELSVDPFIGSSEEKYDFTLSKQSSVNVLPLSAAPNYKPSASDDTTFSVYNAFLETQTRKVVYGDGAYTINNEYSGLEVNVRISEEYANAAKSVGLDVDREWWVVSNTQTPPVSVFYNAVIKALFFDWGGDLEDGCKTGDYKKVLQALALTTGYDLEVSIGAMFEHGGFISTEYKVHFSHTSSDMLSAMALSNDSIIFNA